MMKWIAAVFLLPVWGMLPVPVFAYVGPGAGLSLLGALWALIAAIAAALFFIIAWPVRKALRRRRERQSADQDRENRTKPAQPATPEPDDQSNP